MVDIGIMAFQVEEGTNKVMDQGIGVKSKEEGTQEGKKNGSNAEEPSVAQTSPLGWGSCPCWS